MASPQKNRIATIRVIAVFLFLCLVAGGFFYSRFVSIAFGSQTAAKPTPTPRSGKTKPKKTIPNKAALPTSKYSKFEHNSHAALKLECSACHKVPTENWEKVRSKETAFPDVTDYPKHESCLSCHREQFFSGKPPAICSNCHTNPSPIDNSRHPFPNPREIFDSSPKGKKAVSSFEISFPHDKHVEIVSRNANPFEKSRKGVSFVNARMTMAGEESCAVCHQTYKPQDKSDDEYFLPPPKDLGDAFWLKKGTFKSGPANHATCFSCHSADTGILPAPTDCATCHKQKEPQVNSDFDAKLAETIGITDKEMLLDWRRRDSSGTFRHEFFSHAEMSCSSCHNILTMNTTDSKTKKVSISSCDNCHITGTLDDGGILNFEIDSRKKDAKFECVKCHVSFGKMAIPDSHIKAVPYLSKGK